VTGFASSMTTACPGHWHENRQDLGARDHLRPCTLLSVTFSARFTIPIRAERRAVFSSTCLHPLLRAAATGGDPAADINKPETTRHAVRGDADTTFDSALAIKHQATGRNTAAHVFSFSQFPSVNSSILDQVGVAHIWLAVGD
jgi:hypothetical protein